MKFKLNNKLCYSLYVLLVCIIFSLTSCDDYPNHKVLVGKQLLIVYKVETINGDNYGTWRYAVSDATGRGWTLQTFERFQIGDTLYISNQR